MGLENHGLGWGCLRGVGKGLCLSSTRLCQRVFFPKAQLVGWVPYWCWVVQGGGLALGPIPTTSPLLSCSIEGEYVPVEGDEVTYKVCPIPPKNQKFQAVEVVLTNLAPHTKHETWSGQIIGS